MSEEQHQLRHWLYGEILELEQSYCDDRDYLKTAFLLRDWVGRHATFSHKEHILDHGKLDFWQLLRGLLELRGGVWCGGVAELFFGLAQCFPGLYVAKYGYGLHTKNISHVTNLVALKDGTVYNLDAYLGYHWVYAGSNEMMDFGTLLHRIRRGDYSTIARVDIALPRPAVAGLDDDGRNFKWLFPDGIPEPDEKDGLKVWRSATPSYGRLYREGSHNRVRIDAVRGDKPLDEFMLDLMRREVSISRFSGEDLESTEYKAFREVLKKVL